MRFSLYNIKSGPFYREGIPLEVKALENFGKSLSKSLAFERNSRQLRKRLKILGSRCQSGDVALKIFASTESYN